MLVQSGLISCSPSTVQMPPVQINQISTKLPLSSQTTSVNPISKSTNFNSTTSVYGLGLDKSPTNYTKGNSRQSRKISQSPNQTKQPLQQQNPFQFQSQPFPTCKQKNPFEPPNTSSIYYISVNFYPPNFAMLEKEHKNIERVFKMGSNPELIKHSRFIMQQILMGISYCQVNRRNIGI